MRILAIGAHPDDIELAMGGTLYEFTKKGIDVLCYLTTNGTYSDVYGNPIRFFDEIIETTRKSLGLLGVLEKNIIINRDINATELSVNKTSISEVQKIILQNEITEIFTHMKIDTYHQDHQATHHIAMAAARRYVNNLYCFESIFNFADGQMLPNCYVDISDCIKTKLDALKMHSTEYEKFGGEHWLQSIKSLANFRGIQIGVQYAEAFNVIKQFRKI